MWIQFFLENAHFSINIFAALVFLALFWLYLDALAVKKTLKESLKICAFLILSFSFVLQAIYLESSILKSTIFRENLYLVILPISRILGYLMLIAGLLIDPLQPRPKSAGEDNDAGVFAPLSAVGFSPIGLLLAPILCAICAFLYIRRATVGLELHVRTVAFGFFVLSIYELVQLTSVFGNSPYPNLVQTFGPFGPVWILRHVILFAATVILGKWVSAYLTKRFVSQLFMIFTVAVLAIFLTTTVTFSGLLLKSIQKDALSQLETNVKVLNYAIEAKKTETLANSQTLSQDPQIGAEVEAKARQNLADIAERSILNKNESSVVIVNETGQVQARGEDRERIGDSLSGDPLVKRALLSKSSSTVVTKEGAMSSEISIRSASPIKVGDKTVGAVICASTIDNAFLDGIKKATGLEASVYAGSQLSATTIVSADGKTRWTGIKEQNKKITQEVLIKGNSFTGTINLLSRPYFAAYLPIKDVDNSVVGMLFVGREQVTILQTAASSIELTFIVTAILLVLSIVPAYLVARYITSQIK